MKKLTKSEIDTIVWELEQGKRGDNSTYDKKLDRIISKLRSEDA